MSVAQRTERVSFRQQTRTLRSDGGYDTVTATDSTVWASVRPVRATESEQNGRLAGMTIYLVSILADELPADASVDDTLRWDTAPRGALDMNIREIRESYKRPLETEIVCESGVNE